jgi:hypothetical protein
MPRINILLARVIVKPSQTTETRVEIVTVLLQYAVTIRVTQITLRTLQRRKSVAFRECPWKYSPIRRRISGRPRERWNTETK